MHWTGPSPKRPRSAHAALDEIITLGNQWIRRYWESWFDNLPVKHEAPRPVLDSASDVRGSASLDGAIAVTKQLAEVARDAHKQLAAWRKENAMLDAKQAKKKPAKRKTAKKRSK